MTEAHDALCRTCDHPFSEHMRLGPHRDGGHHFNWCRACSARKNELNSATDPTLKTMTEQMFWDLLAQAKEIRPRHRFVMEVEP